MSKKYKIVITTRGASNIGAASVPENPVASNRDEAPEAPEAPTRSSTFGKVMSGAGMVLSVATVASSIQMQEVNIVTGQTQLAQARQAQLSFAGKGLGLIGAATSGSVIATALGIAGGPIGASIGVATYVGKSVFDLAIKGRERDLKKRVEDEQLEALRSRAGASFNRSRLNS